MQPLPPLRCHMINQRPIEVRAEPVGRPYVRFAGRMTMARRIGFERTDGRGCGGESAPFEHLSQLGAPWPAPPAYCGQRPAGFELGFDNALGGRISIRSSRESSFQNCSAPRLARLRKPDGLLLAQA